VIEGDATKDLSRAGRRLAGRKTRCRITGGAAVHEASGAWGQRCVGPAVRGASEARGGVTQDLALQLITRTVRGASGVLGQRCVGPAVHEASGA